MSIDSIFILLLVFLLIFPLSPAALADELSDTLQPASEPEIVTLPQDVEPAETTEAPTIIYVTEAPTAPVYMDIIQRDSMSTFQAIIFAGFLICGTIVGLHLLRGRYGT